MNNENDAAEVKFRVRKLPRQKRSRSTVDSIKQAVLELAKKEGFSELTTTQIAERAGVSKGSLYQYFSGKEAIFLALFEDATTRLATEMKEMFFLTLDMSPEVSLPKVIRKHLSLVRQHELVLLHMPVQVPQLRLDSQPVTYERMVARFTRISIQERCPELSKKEVEYRTFFVHEIVTSCISSFVKAQPKKMPERAFIKELSGIIASYTSP
jgi:AcrR family transcriptional regulator